MALLGIMQRTNGKPQTVDQNSYYVLPNQMMPQYHKFRLHFFATSLDYYTSVGDKELQIRWSEKDENDEIML